MRARPYLRKYDATAPIISRRSRPSAKTSGGVDIYCHVQIKASRRYHSYVCSEFDFGTQEPQSKQSAAIIALHFMALASKSRKGMRYFKFHFKLGVANMAFTYADCQEALNLPLKRGIPIKETKTRIKFPLTKPRRFKFNSKPAESYCVSLHFRASCSSAFATTLSFFTNIKFSPYSSCSSLVVSAPVCITMMLAFKSKEFSSPATISRRC